jgi:hypothetical protein
MTIPDQRPDTPGYEVDDEMDLLFARANPNPTRLGCPSTDVLKALSRKERSITDPGYEHLAQCSPCYREFRGFQQADARARVVAAQARRRWLLAAAAAILIVGVGSWAALRRNGAPPTATSTNSSLMQTARLDLRPFSVTRGTERRQEPDPVVLPRGRISATILLPVGAEPGEYEVRLLDQDLTVRASSAGSAAIRNYVTTLEATLDGSSISSGRYQLGIRRVGGDWQMFPVTLQ